MVTLVVFALVAVTVTLVLQNSAKSKQRTTARIESEQAARAALDLMTRDIRSAGYGADLDAATPQPAIAYIDAQEIILSQNQLPFPENPTGPIAPLAYSPTSNPKPFPLVGTTYTPPMRYRTGAELIRYTLDVNNDGAVNATDISAPQGADAAATVNPNDYVLVREVFGDSTGNVAGSNGGAQERVALIRKPGGGVPSIFTVYMRGSNTPWDWANGPVPASQLSSIERIELKVTAAASRPDAKGQYAQTTISSNVNSNRSVPDFGATTYVVSGYVFDDKNYNHAMDGIDVGVANATVRMGSYVGYSSASGFYQLRVPAGTYTLKHTPAVGYGSYMSPDTFTVSISNAGYTKHFADTARAGGWAHARAYNDLNGNAYWDTGEPAMSGIKFTISPGTPQQTQAYTDASGNAQLFTGVGGYALTCNSPDTMVVTTANPISGTMTNGGSASWTFGLNRQYTGHVQGKVYVDANRDGIAGGSEVGIANVWVGVSKDAGTTVAGYGYTDASGNYDVQVPINDPPHTTAYSVYTIPPAGYFPTASTSIGNLWVTQGGTLTNNNFGMANFQIITLTANRVLSLAAADMIEKDWQGNKTNEARQDKDLLLGADAGATDNVSVWFNRYANSPLFSTTPTNPDGYTRLAPNSVMAMAVDTLDKNDNKLRPDLVTGTKYAISGNFFVWYTQGSSNNEGYFTTTYTSGRNYLTSDNGDVQAVVTMDVGGGSGPDIIVGTKSPIAGQGQVEVWLNNDAAAGSFPSFTRDETFNAVYSTIMGEVNGMTLADMDNDGDRDLLVATRTSDYNGQLIVYDNVGRTAGARFIPRYAVTFGGLTPTTVACLDADGDGWKDIFVGTQRSVSQGRIYQFRNTGSTTPYTYSIVRGIDAPGIVLSLSAGDFGGNASRADLACGFRTSTSGYGGGVTLYFMDLGVIPFLGVDPSAGSVVNMVPALTNANFNYGQFTTTPPSPYLTDLAAGVKASATTGALVVFIR